MVSLLCKCLIARIVQVIKGGHVEAASLAWCTVIIFIKCVKKKYTKLNQQNKHEKELAC